MDFFYSGFAQVTTPFSTALGVYLGCTLNPLNTVDIWIKSHPCHGVPMVQVLQTEGTFNKNFGGWSGQLPVTGYAQLDMYSTTLVNVYKKSKYSLINHFNKFYILI